MKFFVFDSFEGLPEPQGLDAGDMIGRTMMSFLMRVG